MAKLDEIAELLTEEIHDFEQSVKRLEKLQKTLKGYELKPNTSVVEKLLNAHNEKFLNDRKQLIDEIKRLNDKIGGAMVIPKWQVKVFWIWSFLNLIAWIITVVVVK